MRRSRIVLAVAVAAAITASTALVISNGTATAAPQTAGTGSVPVTPNIVGGTPAPAAPPWIAQISFNDHGDPNFGTCTGDLIADDTIVTNAHCVTDANGHLIDLTALGFHVRLGSNSITSGGVDVPLVSGTVFPGWNWGALDSGGRIGDLAILKLGSYVLNQPIGLGTHTLRTGTPVTELGYGVTNPSGNGPEPGVLYQLNVNRVVGAAACDTNPDLPMSVGELCVGNTNATGDCPGDSGGPLLRRLTAQEQRTGIPATEVDYGGVSRSPGLLPGCGGEADVYTDRAYYRPWILAVERGEDPVTAEQYLPPTPTTPSNATAAQAAGRARAEATWRSRYALAG